MVKFIIISRQRSGSGLLRTYLKSHPDLNCIQTELPFMTKEHFEKTVSWSKIKSHVKFIPFNKKIYVNGKVVPSQKKVSKYNKRQFPRIFYRALSENTGFDVKYDSISRKSDFSDIYVIHLIRKNTFEQAISKWIEANQHLTYRPTRRVVGDQNPVSQAKFNINKKELKTLILEMKKQKKRWSQTLSGHKVLTLYYEDICDSNQTDETVAYLPEQIGREICHFLQVPYVPMTSDRMKVNSDKYEDYVLNWSKIKGLQRFN